MKIRMGALLLVVVGLVGCGGGGGSGSGGSGSPSPAPTPPPSGGGGPPPSQQEPPPSASTAPSTAEVVFPWHDSAALASTVTVSGKASDPDGVAAVRVNGITATLFPTTEGPIGSARSLSSLQARTPLAVLLSDDEEDSAEVEWVVELPLEDGENELVVTVEDSTGDVTEDDSVPTVRYYLVPIPFHLDAYAPRVVGRSQTLTQSGSVELLVQHDYATREQVTYPELSDIPVADCFRALSNEWLYLTMTGPNDWQLRSFDLTSRGSTTIATVGPQVLDPGNGFEPALFGVRLVCNDALPSAYMLASYSDGNDLAKSRIIAVDAGGAEILTETDPDEAQPWLAREIALAADAIISLRGMEPNAPLTRIELANGARSSLVAAVGGLALAPTLDGERVYVATMAGIEEIDLSVEPVGRRNISDVSSTDPFVFSEVRAMALDLVNNRIIVGDSGLDALIAVDLDTGERSDFLSRKIGAGAPLIAPRRMALTADGALAYVADDGGNAPERLFEIDLVSGERRLVGANIDHPFNVPLTGLALDEEAGHAYVSYHDRILRVDVETGDVVSVAWNSTHNPSSPLQYIADVLLDTANERLLVGDSVSAAIYSLNLGNSQLDLLSQEGTHGDGDAFVTIASMTMTEDGSVIYVADQGTDQIVRVDAETGDREPLQTTCPLGAEPETLSQVLYDGNRDELLIRADGLFAHRFGGAGCTPIPSKLHPLDVRLTPSGHILAAAFNAVVQIDRRSGDLVIVSK